MHSSFNKRVTFHSNQACTYFYRYLPLLKTVACSVSGFTVQTICHEKFVQLKPILYLYHKYEINSDNYTSCVNVTFHLRSYLICNQLFLEFSKFCIVNHVSTYPVRDRRDFELHSFAVQITLAFMFGKHIQVECTIKAIVSTTVGFRYRQEIFFCLYWFELLWNGRPDCRTSFTGQSRP